MIYVGSIDFINGDFTLRHFEASNIIEASEMQNDHVKKNYSGLTSQICKVSVNDIRYIDRILDER